MAIYTVKNRYHEPFTGMWDGESYTVVDTLAVPDFIALHLKKQSIIKDNPITGANDYQLAIRELGEDESPIDGLPVETLDHTDMDWPKVEIRQSGVKNAAPARRSNFGSLDVSSSAKER